MGWRSLALKLITIGHHQRRERAAATAAGGSMRSHASHVEGSPAIASFLTWALLVFGGRQGFAREKRGPEYDLITTHFI